MNFKLHNDKKVTFLRQLALIYDSDILSTDGLDLLKNSEKDPNLQAFYAKLLDEMIMGTSLSMAINNSCDFFKYYEIKLIELGEKSGNIAKVLNDMANSIEKEGLLKEKLNSSFRYPIILASLTLIILFIIISVIVPVYHDLVVSSGAKIGWFMSALNSLGLFIKTNIKAILIGIVIIVVDSIIYNILKSNKNSTNKYSIKYIITKNIRLKSSSIVFTRNLAMLLESGIDYMDAFDILEQAEANSRLKTEIYEAKTELAKTSSLTQAMKKFTLFPDVLHEMLRVAVSTGHVVPSLKRIEQTMLISLNKDIERLVSMIEPIITIIISLLVAAVLISGVMPVFKILTSLV